MASFQRSLIGPARRALALARSNTSKASAPRILARSMATVGNTPPMEPQKQRPHEMAVGEFEGAGFTIEPLRRVGEDDKTMRARLVCTSFYCFISIFSLCRYVIYTYISHGAFPTSIPLSCHPPSTESDTVHQ